MDTFSKDYLGHWWACILKWTDFKTVQKKDQTFLWSIHLFDKNQFPFFGQILPIDKSIWLQTF